MITKKWEHNRNKVKRYMIRDHIVHQREQKRKRKQKEILSYKRNKPV